MDFIPIPTPSILSKQTDLFYLLHYDISFNKSIIATIKILKYDIKLNTEIDIDLLSSVSKIINPNIYLLDINIPIPNNKFHYKEIVKQCLIKYINVSTSSKDILITIINKNNYFEILTLLSEKFTYLQNLQNQQDNKIYIFIASSSDRKKSIQSIIPNIKLKMKYHNIYIISAPKIGGLIYVTLQNYLNNAGLTELFASNTYYENNQNIKPFLLWQEILENYKFNPIYYNTKCFIMNILGDSKSIITNKYNLFFNFKKYFPNQYNKYIPETWDFRQFIKSHQLRQRITQKGDIFIVRPAGNGAHSGIDVHIVTTEKDLEIASLATKKYKDVLITEYIHNPLLYNRKKFHLRIYFIMAIINGHFMTKILDFYEILTAKIPYKNSDFKNKEIHDTHASSTERDFIFPHDITDSNLYNDFVNIYIPKIKECFLLISKFCHNKISKYDQSEHAFEIFGCDIIIKDTHEIALLEINDRLGFGLKKLENTLKISKLYFETIINLILNPLLTNQPIDKDNWLFYK